MAVGLAAAVEGDSEHIVARAIRQAAQARQASLPMVSDFQAIQGRGVRVTSDGHNIHLGGPRLLELLGLELPDTFQSVCRATREQKGKRSSTWCKTISSSPPLPWPT